MGNTYTQLLYHIVFAVKNRRALLEPPLREATWAYLAGIVTNLGGNAYAIGGVADHVHVLCDFPSTMAVADFVRSLKANSARWLRDERRFAMFAWQAGYAAFTISRRHLDAVRGYVANQPAHHEKVDFGDELKRLFSRAEIEFDERYLPRVDD